MSDILILGGGVAGLSLAIALRKIGYSVNVVEKSNYENFIHGEHVPSSIVNLLEVLSIPKSVLAENSIRCNGVIGYWTNKEVVKQGIFNHDGFDFILNRPRFEFSLSLFAKSLGITFYTGTRLSKIETNKAILTNGLTFNFDYLFDCTGRNSSYHNNTRLIFDSMIGITYTTPHNVEKEDSEIIIDSTENGWWYSVSNSNYSAVTFFTDKDIFKTLNLKKELDNTKLVKEIFKMPFAKPKIMSCHTSILKSIPNKVFQVGDSFSSYDPLSSLGIYKAFSNAIVISEYFDIKNKELNKAYKTFQNEFLKYIKIRTEFYKQGHEYYKSEFYKRRVID